MAFLETTKQKFYNEQEIEKNVKSSIQDILRSYRNFWDPYAELLQNSVDAINRRYGLLNDPSYYLYDEIRKKYNVYEETDYVGKILIEIWKDKRKIRISDNGTGIQKELVEEILQPEGTDKKRGKDYGYKGKGLTYAAFVSKSFSIQTQYFLEKESAVIKLDGLFDWVRTEDNSVAFPNTPIPSVQIDSNMEDFNTVIEVALSDEYDIKFPAISSLDDAFRLFENESLIDSFQMVLRTKTALGNTNYLFGREPIVPINIELVVFENEDSECYRKEVPYKFYHPKEHPEAKDLSFEFYNYVIEKQKAGFDGKFYCLNYAKKDQTIGQRLPVKANIYLSVISSTRLNWINNQLGLVDNLKDAGFGYGVYLAINGMPTGIRIDDWETKGAANKRYYAIVDCDLSIGDELDSGRKGISYNRTVQISDFVLEMRHDKIKNSHGEEVGEKLFAYANSGLIIGDPYPMSEGFGDTFEGDFETKVQDALADAELDLKERTEIYSFIKANTSLNRIPRNEEEVRTLFHELLAKGMIKGYKTIYDAANRSDYDSALDYTLNLNEGIKEENDPLGIPITVMQQCERRKINVLNYTSIAKILSLNLNAMCVEYKFDINGLLYELTKKNSNTPKIAEKMDLLIVWDHNVSSSYEEECTLAEISPATKYFHSVTHILRLKGTNPTAIYVISLSKVIEKLMVS